jgi:SAM-dependent methyltransferase
VKFCYGVDIAPSMLRQARVNADAQNVHFRCNNGCDLSEFADGILDLVYSIFVFQHMPRESVASYFRDSLRTLREGGKFVFQMMVDDSGIQLEPPAAHPYGLRYYTRTEVRNLVEDTGFGDLRIYDFESWEPSAAAEAGDLLFVATKPPRDRLIPDMTANPNAGKLPA